MLTSKLATKSRWYENYNIVMRVYRTTLVLLAVLVVLVGACTDQSSCFLKKLFDFSYPEENVYSINLDGNWDSLKSNILGYGDFNNDLRADYVAVDPTSSNLLFFTYQNGGNQQGYYTLTFEVSPLSDCIPLNVYIYDINLDGKLDVTVWGEYTNQSKCLFPMFQGENGTFGSPMLIPKLYPSPNTTQPILFESMGIFNFGVKTSFLLIFDTQQSLRRLLYFSLNSYVDNDWSALFVGGTNANIPFSNQHWNSFIDITSDCNPDMVLTNSKGEIQFWISTSNRFNLHSVVTTTVLQSIGIRQLASLNFADVNYDGEQDLVLANSTAVIVLFSNQQASSQFCVTGKTTFGFHWNTPFVLLIPQLCTLSQQNIHFGDLNIDGYVDLLFSCAIGGVSQLYVYENTFDKTEGRGFELFDTYQDAVNSMVNSGQVNVTSVSLFDILQNGIIDIMVQVNGQRTIVLYNNYLYQNYFYIKGLATNSVLDQIGTQVPGATFYWLNSLGNSPKVTVYSQIFQTAYGATPMPYVLTGLGRANNYVEQFTMGRLGSKKSWSPIIPNSQLAVFSGSQKAESWSIKIFIMPTDSIVYVLIVCIVILAILGSVLIFLKCKSKKSQNVLLQDYS